MKHEWKKQEKALYLPQNIPTLIEVPKQKFFTLTGNGNPNDQPFGDKVGALFSLSWAVRMMPKQGFTPEGYAEYTVYPLEGIWAAGQDSGAHGLNKDALVYTIMVRQPDFVNEEVFARALAITKQKKPSPFLDDVQLVEMEDGLCVQMMHLGSYDDEPASFALMTQFLSDSHLERTAESHREIYISDSRKALPEKMKTVLRYTVRETTN